MNAQIDSIDVKENVNEIHDEQRQLMHLTLIQGMILRKETKKQIYRDFVAYYISRLRDYQHQFLESLPFELKSLPIKEFFNNSTSSLLSTLAALKISTLSIDNEAIIGKDRHINDIYSGLELAAEMEFKGIYGNNIKVQREDKGGINHPSKKEKPIIHVTEEAKHDKIQVTITPKKQKILDTDIQKSEKMLKIKKAKTNIKTKIDKGTDKKRKREDDGDGNGNGDGLLSQVHLKSNSKKKVFRQHDEEKHCLSKQKVKVMGIMGIEKHEHVADSGHVFNVETNNNLLMVSPTKRPWMP